METLKSTEEVREEGLALVLRRITIAQLINFLESGMGWVVYWSTMDECTTYFDPVGTKERSESISRIVMGISYTREEIMTSFKKHIQPYLK